jgi:hypothetical protein
VSEPFWYIFANYRPAADANAAGAAGGGGQQQQQQQQQQPSCEFKWARDRLFDRDVATMLYEAATQEPVTATVMQVRRLAGWGTDASGRHVLLSSSRKSCGQLTLLGPC